MYNFCGLNVKFSQIKKLPTYMVMKFGYWLTLALVFKQLSLERTVYKSKNKMHT